MGNEMVKEIDKDPAVDISDHIAEAYFGEMGEAMRQSSVKRIDWICEQACGPRVLDVGCSQGITEILLGRRKIHALGVDIAPKAIAYAEKLLAAEAPDVREYVRFLRSDFLVEDLPEKEFDTLILSEILEHLYEPEEMLKKAFLHLRDGGRAIITVPFGINDFPDHKQTFYVLGIWELLQKHSVIEQVEFMGSWIGFVAVKQAEPKRGIPGEIPFSLLRREEEAFFALERMLRDSEKNLRWKLTETVETARQKLVEEKEKSKRAAENYETAKQWLAEEKEKSRRAAENYETTKQWLAEEKEKSRRAAENYETAKQWLAEEKEKTAADLARAAKAYDDLRQSFEAEQEERASAEMKYLQLEFLMHLREEESLSLQSSLTQRIVKDENDLRAVNQQLKNAEKQLKEKTLPPIWYTMAGSRVGRALCRLFDWYHNFTKRFRKQEQ